MLERGEQNLQMLLNLVVLRCLPETPLRNPFRRPRSRPRVHARLSNISSYGLAMWYPGLRLVQAVTNRASEPLPDGQQALF